MRVFGRGGGYFGDSPGERRQRSDAQAFSKGRRVGQVVRGRLMAPAEDGLAWVSVAGHTLLARLDHLPTGGELLFRIERLAPELVLKDITPTAPAAGDPVRLLAALTEARSRLEGRLDGRLDPGPAPLLDLTAARRRFHDLLDRDPEARQAWTHILDLGRLVTGLLPAEVGRFHHLPWIFPGLAQSELLAKRDDVAAGGPAFHLRLFGRLPQTGWLAAGIDWRPGQVQYALGLERPRAAETLIARLAVVRFGRAELSPRCLSAGPLPGELAGGLLARLLAGRARPFTGLRLQV